MNSSLNSSTVKKHNYLLAILIGALFVLFLANLLFGSSDIGIKEIIASFSNDNSTVKAVLLSIRLPRALASIIVGMALSISGLILQITLNNSLASPGIIGINSGSAFLVTLVSFIFPLSIYARTIAAFIGAFLATIIIYFIAKISGAKRSTIILSGIAISSLFTALTNTLISLDLSTLIDKTAFTIGSFRYVTGTQVLLSGIGTFIVLIFAYFLMDKLSILSLGDEVALSLGLNVKATRFIALIISSLLAAFAVSIGGILSFLGLIAPHIMRKILGYEKPKKLFFYSMIFAADITLLCDLLSKVLFKPYELPIGILLSLLGVPFFIYLLLSKTRRDRFDTM